LSYVVWCKLLCNKVSAERMMIREKWGGGGGGGGGRVNLTTKGQKRKYSKGKHKTVRAGKASRRRR